MKRQYVSPLCAELELKLNDILFGSDENTGDDNFNDGKGNEEDELSF